MQFSLTKYPSIRKHTRLYASMFRNKFTSFWHICWLALRKVAADDDDDT